MPIPTPRAVAPSRNAGTKKIAAEPSAMNIDM